MKTLIIVTHPHIEDSLINKRWIEELEKYGTLINIFALEYDGKIEKANYLNRLGGENSFSNWTTSIESDEYRFSRNQP